MSITIGDTLLNYKINEDKYIITYIEEYNAGLDTILKKIFDRIFAHYEKGSLSYRNVCGVNAEFICKNLKISGLTLGKIIINNWVTINDKVIEQIESVYGDIDMNIGVSYHALAYLTVIIEGTNYYVAIETTSCVPYKLQFYVASNQPEFEQIIKTRYQCSNFKISFDCEKDWEEIASSSGGKKTKNKKTKKQKNEKRKNKKTKNQKMGVLRYIRVLYPN
jgi:hypothetical protein